MKLRRRYPFARRRAGQAVSRERHKKAPRHVDTEMRVQPRGFNRLTRSRPIQLAALGKLILPGFCG
ncbi:MAG: hypothetical protein RLZZ245_613 [Verrucomicrobiota bacterium]